MNELVENKLRNVIRQIIREIIQEKASHNVKVYLKPGEKAPQGAKVSQGARGGKYYYTMGASGHRGYPKKSDAKLRKFAKDAGLDPDHKDTIDAFNKTEDGKAKAAKLKTDDEGTHSVEHKGSKYYSKPGESKEDFIKRAKQNIASDHKDYIEVSESKKS